MLFQLTTIQPSQRGYSLKITAFGYTPFIYPGDVHLGIFVPLHSMRTSESNRSLAVRDVKIGGPMTKIGFKFLEAILSAIDEINGRQDYLNVTLGAVVYDSYNDPDTALDESLVLISKMSLVGVVGPAISDVAMSVANLFKLFAIPQISYYTDAPKLSDHRKFPTFLRTVPSARSTVKALVRFLRRYDWIYVNVITDNSDYGESTLGRLQEELYAAENTVCLAQTIRLGNTGPRDNDWETELKLLWQSESRVNVILCSSLMTSWTIKTVSKWPKHIRDRFLWIGTNSILEDFPNLENPLYANSVNLSATDFAHFILVLPKIICPDIVEKYRMNLQRDYGALDWRDNYLLTFCGCIPNATGAVVSEKHICNDLQSQRCLHELHKDAVFYVPNTQNAVYSLAEALRRCEIRRSGKSLTCANQQPAVETLLHYLRNYNFTGFGNKTFDFFKNSDGYPRYTIISYSASLLKWEVLVEYDDQLLSPFYNEDRTVLNQIQITHANSHCSEPCDTGQAVRPDPRIKCCWLCLNCSHDQIVTQLSSNDAYLANSSPVLPSSVCRFCEPGTKPNENRTRCDKLPLVHMNLKNPFAIAVVTVCLTALVITIVTTVVYAYHWCTPVIRASGRESTIVLLLGIFLSYIFPIVIVSRGPELSICVVALVAPGLCSAISYAAIFARIHRIERIFRANQSALRLPRKYTSRKYQVILMLVIVSTEVILLGITLYLWPPTVKKVLHGQPADTGYHPKEPGYEVIVQVGIENNRLVCFDSISVVTFTGLLIPVFLMIVTMIHAYKVRKVPTGFNEARALGFVNYVNAILFIMIPIMMQMIPLQTTEMIPLSVLLIITATNQLCVLVLPKIYIVLFKPHKNTRLGIMQRIRTQSQIDIIDNMNELIDSRGVRLATLNGLAANNQPFQELSPVDLSLWPGTVERQLTRKRAQTNPEAPGIPSSRKKDGRVERNKTRYHSTSAMDAAQTNSENVHLLDHQSREVAFKLPIQDSHSPTSTVMKDPDVSSGQYPEHHTYVFQTRIRYRDQ
ncbi:hypothetical protein D915_003115 [Fasciola hepatica]|uniref:G-protein coupled receptors family 3 profile domain-containing protein n=1 Tax=Fasciola hepatica TaxID=6192 RepID=A0A4E0RWZ4_FASHE|nr:hypothetical protein D915_003115 [Fasciola hepatica]